MPAPSSPYVLVRPPDQPVWVPQLDASQQAVVDHAGGPLLVLAGPGTGKTTTIVESVAARIERGADPESVLVLTFGRKASAEVRERVTSRLSVVTREPLARTFHSYAFGLLRREAARRGQPTPRLLTGAEQTVRVRELLAGRTDRWPEAMRAAVETSGFARELRDLVLRAYERGLTPDDLRRLGGEHARPAWVAAGRVHGRVRRCHRARRPVGLRPGRAHPRRPRHVARRPRRPRGGAGRSHCGLRRRAAGHRPRAGRAAVDALRRWRRPGRGR